MVGRVKAARLYGGLAVETTLDPREQPFLFDHQIDGVPVLPGVMGTEAFAEVASVLCPGFHVAAIEDESFLLPFKFYRNQPATLHLRAVASPGGVGEVVVSAELRSVVQPKPELPAQERVHFRARVRMRREAAAKPKVAFKKPAAKALGIGREAIYEVYFHGPAYQVIERAAVEGDGVVALMAARPAAERDAGRGRRAAWRRGCSSCASRPRGCGCWRGSRRWPCRRRSSGRSSTGPEDAAGGKRLYVTVEVRGDGEAFDARVVDEKGLVHAEVVGLPHRRAARAADARGARGPAMKRSFSRVAIVNRGEAALRFLHAALELNREGERLHTIALYTEPDRHALFVREADEAWDLGPAMVAGGDGAPQGGLRGPRRGWSRRCARRGPRPPGRAGASWPSSRRSRSCASGSGSRSSAPRRRRCARSATRSRASVSPRASASPSCRGPGRRADERGRGGAAGRRAGLPGHGEGHRRHRRPRHPRGGDAGQAPDRPQGRAGGGAGSGSARPRCSWSGGSTASATSTCRS